MSRNQEGWQNKLKKRNTLTAPEKLLQSEDTSEKNILLYKMKNVSKEAKVCGAGRLARIPRVGLCERQVLKRGWQWAEGDVGDR